MGTEFDLIVTNTMFKQKDVHNTTKTHPCSRHGHMIDFIITRCRDKMDICSTRTMRGETCGTDRQMLRSEYSGRLQKVDRTECGNYHWRSAVSVQVSHAYRNIDTTRERITRVLHLRVIFLSLQIILRVDNAAVAGSILAGNWL